LSIQVTIGILCTNDINVELQGFLLIHPWFGKNLVVGVPVHQEKSENSANSKGFMSACREEVVISWFDICGLLSFLDMFRPFKVYPPKKMVKGGHAANPLNMGSVLFV